MGVGITVRPDNGLKKWPNFFLKMPKKVAAAVFTFKVMFENTPKVTKHLGYFWKTICYQELSKIPQSGDTGGGQVVSVLASTQTIWVWIPPKPTVLTVKFGIEKNENKEKETGVGQLLTKHFSVTFRFAQITCRNLI